MYSNDFFKGISPDRTPDTLGFSFQPSNTDGRGGSGSVSLTQDRGDESCLYLDCNATTPVHPRAAQAALEGMKVLYGNPSSNHSDGIQARYLLESARKAAAQAVGAQCEEIFFTSGATEAIHLAVFSAVMQVKKAKKRGKVLYSAIEHKAVSCAIEHWVDALDVPLEIISIPVDSRGQISLAALQAHLDDAVLVCTMAANNETGAIQDLDAIEKLLFQSGREPLWLVDCVQTIGKSRIHLNRTRIHYGSFSGHKFYAPKGVGFLYVRQHSPLFPLIVGGGQEHGIRSGTENLPGVVAMGAALEEIAGQYHQSEGKSEIPTPEARMRSFQKKLIAALKDAFSGVVFNTSFEHSLRTTINFSVPGIGSDELLNLFDSAGMRLSAGSACSAKLKKPSYVLEAMGVEPWRALSAVRLSFGIFTSANEIERACQKIRECADALQSSCISSKADLKKSSLGREFEISAPQGLLQYSSEKANSWLYISADSPLCILINPEMNSFERISGLIECKNLQLVATIRLRSPSNGEDMEGDYQGSKEHIQLVEIAPLKLECKALLLGKNRQGEQEVFIDLSWDQGSNKFQCNFELEEFSPQKISKEVIEDSVIPEQQKARMRRVLLIGIVKDGVVSKEGVRFVFFRKPEDLQGLKGVVGANALLCPAEGEVSRYLNLEQGDKDSMESDADILISASELRGLIEKGDRKFSIIDVRDSQEHLLFDQWSQLGLTEAPKNVPLAQLVELGSGLIRAHAEGDVLVCLCRSGNRSLEAARILRNWGFSQVKTLSGGLALIAMKS